MLVLQEGRQKRDALREMYDKYEGWISVGGTDSRVSAQTAVSTHLVGAQTSNFKQHSTGLEKVVERVCRKKVEKGFSETTAKQLYA